VILPLEEELSRQGIDLREYLHQRLYVDNASSYDIATELNLSVAMLSEYVLYYGWRKRQQTSPLANLTNEELYELLHRLHVEEGLTHMAIGRLLHTDPSTVSRIVKLFGLDPGRPLVNQIPECPISYEELYDRHVNQHQSMYRLTRTLGASEWMIERWLSECGARPNRFGRSAHVAEREREFSETTKAIILHRDSWRCAICNSSDRWKLQVHHIVPVLHGGTNDESNGVSLCGDCHRSIQGRELELAEYFQELLRVQTCYIGESPEEDDTEGTYYQV